jgi:hypothetical protein
MCGTFMYPWTGVSSSQASSEQVAAAGSCALMWSGEPEWRCAEAGRGAQPVVAAGGGQRACARQPARRPHADACADGPALCAATHGLPPGRLSFPITKARQPGTTPMRATKSAPPTNFSVTLTLWPAPCMGGGCGHGIRGGAWPHRASGTKPSASVAAQCGCTVWLHRRMGAKAHTPCTRTDPMRKYDHLAQPQESRSAGSLEDDALEPHAFQRQSQRQSVAESRLLRACQARLNATEVRDVQLERERHEPARPGAGLREAVRQDSEKYRRYERQVR